MKRKLSKNYSILSPASIGIKLAYRARLAMFGIFTHEFQPVAREAILDVGVTSDSDYSTSNYFEALYPNKDSLVCCGIDDASFLEKEYPGVCFIRANGLALPFKDQAFDYVHSSAVIEHVGSFSNQACLLKEIARVTKKGFFITTPNRWFPIEFHTGLPLIHWFPKSIGRNLFYLLGYQFYSQEINLNLIDERALKKITCELPQFDFQFLNYKLFGWKSNLVLLAHRRHIKE